MTLSCYKSHKHQITKFIVRFIVIQRRFCTDIRLINSYKLQNSTMVLYSYFFYCMQPICKVLIILQLYLKIRHLFLDVRRGTQYTGSSTSQLSGKNPDVVVLFYWMGCVILFKCQTLSQILALLQHVIDYNFYLNIYERCV